jgi:hypothetical protein
VVLHWSRPQKHPKTSVCCFGQPAPADPREKFGNSEVSWSLRSKNPEEAKVATARLRVQALPWQAMRAAHGPIPHKQSLAPVGEHHRDLMAMLEDEPRKDTIWPEIARLNENVAATAEAPETWIAPTADKLLLDAGGLPPALIAEHAS